MEESLNVFANEIFALPHLCSVEHIRLAEYDLRMCARMSNKELDAKNEIGVFGDEIGGNVKHPLRMRESLNAA